MKALVISTLICSVIGAGLYFLDFCKECLTAKISATYLIVLWVTLSAWFLRVKTLEKN